MADALKGIRSQEASHAVKMARIRACNMALFFFIMPVSSFVLFATVSAPTPCLDLCNSEPVCFLSSHASVFLCPPCGCMFTSTRSPASPQGISICASEETSMSKVHPFREGKLARHTLLAHTL